MIQRRKPIMYLESPTFKHSALYCWIEGSLKKISYDLTESNCIFKVFDVIVEKQNFIALQLYVKPTVGLFSEIQFRPHIYFARNDFMTAPRIYNDRRIFHPNICVQSCALVIPEVLNWNPTIELDAFLRKIKYTIVQPIGDCVPNNKINRKAAVTYQFAKANYQSLFMQYTPLYLDEVFGSKSVQVRGLVSEHYYKMDIQQIYHSKHNIKIEVCSVIPKKRPCVRQDQVQSQGEELVNILTKQIKTLNMDQTQKTQFTLDFSKKSSMDSNLDFQTSALPFLNYGNSQINKGILQGNSPKMDLQQ